jgi:ribosomal protein S12 methylthiotransferase accessory factor YcaO
VESHAFLEQLERDQIESLERFRRDLPELRKALANHPDKLRALEEAFRQAEEASLLSTLFAHRF